MSELYSYKNWSREYSDYFPPPPMLHLVDQHQDSQTLYEDIPSNLSYFNEVWGCNLLHRMVQETNGYALEDPQDKGQTRGGPYQTKFSVSELKIYLEICLLIGVKKS